MPTHLRPGWRALATLLTTAGVLHFIKPEFFDRLIPNGLGAPRRWVLVSGAAELAVAASLINHKSRRVGGWAAAGLFVGVFPGNVTMAFRIVRSRRTSTIAKALSIARLPVQMPLVWWAIRVAQHAAPETPERG